MKKITLVLVLLLAFGFAAVAQDEDAAPAVKLTGSLDFTLGADTQTDTPDLPVMSYAKAATAGITVSSADEMVSASIELNLLAASSVSSTTELDFTGPDAYDQYSSLNKAIDAWMNWEEIQAYVAFFNTIFDDVDAIDDDADIFEAADLTAFLAVLNSNVTIGTIAEANADADGVDLYAAIDPTDTVDAAADPGEFVMTDAVGAAMAVLAPTVQFAISTLVDEAIADILDNADTAAVNTLATAAGLGGYVGALVPTTVEALTTGDIEAITAAVDYSSAATAEFAPFLVDVTSTVTLTAPSFIKAASFKLMGVGGVADMVGNMGGQNVKVGNIAVDGKGHSDATVKSYPSISATLASGVVDGLTAGLTFYSDDNADAVAVDAVADTWYTWIDETVAAADPVEPKLGLKVDAGYSTSVGDMTIGAKASIGLYDMLADDTADQAFAFSVMPSFSGFGAKVDVQFDSGLDMTYIGADASYTMMGIVPSVAFDMVTLAEDNVLKYVADGEYASGMDAVKGMGGMAIGGGVTIDVGQFIGMTASVNGGATYAMPTDADEILAWNAGLSVTPIDMLTISAGASDVGIWEGAMQSLMGWNADATVALSPFTIKAGINSAFKANSDGDPVSKFGWSGSLAYTHSIATVTASVGSAWDTADDEDYITWSIASKIKF